MKKTISSLLCLSLLSLSMQITHAQDCNVWDEAGDSKDSYACLAGKGLADRFVKNEASTILDAFDPLAALANFGAGKLWSLIWPQPDPQMEMLEQILQGINDIEAMQQTTMQVMTEDFAATDALIEDIIKSIAGTLGFKLDEAANTLYTELNSTTNGILAFANNPQSQFFTETISSWTFPPIAPYLIIFPSVEEEETPGSNPQNGAYLVINNGDSMPASGWNVGGSKPFSFVIYDGDAIIKQGNTTVWSFSSVYFQLYPLDEAQIANGAISVTGVKFENGQLLFSLSGGTRAQVALGMDNNQYPDDTRNKFTSAIFQSDGSFAAFIPYTYKDLNGNTRQGIPWTNQQMSLFTQEVFNALSMTTEGKQTADALTKTLDYLGVLSTGDKTNINIQDFNGTTLSCSIF